MIIKSSPDLQRLEIITVCVEWINDALDIVDGDPAAITFGSYANGVTDLANDILLRLNHTHVYNIVQGKWVELRP